MAKIVDGTDTTAQQTMSETSAAALAKQYADLLNAEQALKTLKATAPKSAEVATLSTLINQIKSTFAASQNTAETSYASTEASKSADAAAKDAADKAAAKAAADKAAADAKAAADKAAADAKKTADAAAGTGDGTGDGTGGGTGDKKEPNPPGKTEVSRATDPNSGAITITYSDGTTGYGGQDASWNPPTVPPKVKYVAPDGTELPDAESYTAYMNFLTGERANAATVASTAAANASAKALYDAEVARGKKMAKDQVTAWMETLFDKTNASDEIFMKQAETFIQAQIDGDVPAEAIMLNMRGQGFYQTRFSGNAALRKKGLAEMDPADYLRAERSYSQLLTSAGLSNIGTRDTFAKLIGGEVSATELEDRINNVYDRINNADTALQDELGKFFNTGLSKKDLAEALLLGSEGAASLKRKVSMAEISSEFTPRGLTSALGIEQLQQLGVTREQARTGAEYTQQGMESLTKLSDIYNVNQTGLQSELESEAFKGLQSQRRRQLTATEKAAFGGSAGTGVPSLGRSSAGAI